MAEPDTSDPKLREFLQVMGSSRENPLADVSAAGGEGAADRMIPQPAVPEGESDDEYEQIPSRREKQKADVSAKLSAVKAQPPAPRAAPPPREEGKKEQQHDDPEGGTASGDHEKPESADPDKEDAPQATDDDWLRSRTNRLLDLMDPDDLPLEPTGDTGNTAPAEDATVDHLEPEEAEKPLQDAADDAADDKMEVDEPVGDSTVYSIRRTSRLFVRNLAYSATEDDIRKCFEKFGTIEEVRLSFTFSCFSSPC